MASSILNRIIQTLEVLSTFVLAAMMLLTFVDVIGRYILGAPIFGATEMISTMLALAIFLGLGIANARPLLGRAEEITPSPHAIVIAQAAAPPETVVAWLRRWAEPGGLVVVPGGEHPPEVPEIEGVLFEGVDRYRVPCGGPARSLWLGRATPRSGA